MNYLPSLCLIFSIVFFLYKRLKHLLHYFQQEEYDASRFIKYYKNASLIDKKLSLLLIITTLLFSLFNYNYLSYAYSFAFILIGLFEPNREKQAKKALVMTARAKRILFLSVTAGAAIITPFLFLVTKTNIDEFILVIASAQLTPFFLMLGNMFLMPYEKHNQNKFKKEALLKLAAINPKIIGITGSYGKTSTKKLIEHIISSLAPSLATPGSINTLMGICRIIREKLDKAHQYFVVEMGAYGIGSIKRLCDFTPPDVSVITAIGHAHYERFKSLETVAKAKLEIAEATVKKGGFVIVNTMAIAPEFIKMAEGICNNNLRTVGKDASCDYILTNVEQTKDGISLVITNKDEHWDIIAPIYGVHQAENIALAFALCHSLGIDGSTIAAILKTAPQTQHRLEVKRSDSGVTIIDDAYNSNPTGFASALDVLHLLGSIGRKILVTPGMTELGAYHDDAHKKIGEKAAHCADIALIINPKRIPSLISGFENAKGDKALLFDSFADAKKWIDDNAKTNDVILYENDLPDIYEERIKL
ncbi:MAG: UDP-N-acetylmuramoyl-tripeptide--D-alanyl-D-alanine ligase [Alphaproteobacteria bacterium]